ncbi:MAG TPA: restriction endonuclease [Thermoanaerobaculia bacterium]|nr:restriction endonuclease [Thermoanaerobaculia bacterium]
MSIIQVTAQDLRDVVSAIIAPGIKIHRAARNAQGLEIEYEIGPEPCDEEIDDFIASNVLFDEELRMHLIDPGLLGFHSQTGTGSQEAIDEFRRQVGQWAASPEWLEARLPWLPNGSTCDSADSLLWIPDTGPRPGWVVAARSYVLLAAQMLSRGRLLSELSPRDFEFLVGELLEHDGWRVEVTRGTRDGGMDVIATRTDQSLGELRTLWQAKKYAPGNNVRLSQVRELSAVLERERASKALIVTTSQLTRDALAWIRRDTYRLGAKNRKAVEAWVLEAAGLTSSL